MPVLNWEKRSSSSKLLVKNLSHSTVASWKTLTLRGREQKKSCSLLRAAAQAAHRPLRMKQTSQILFPSALKEGCKGVRVWGVGEDTFFMPGGETCFMGTAFCLVSSELWKFDPFSLLGYVPLGPKILHGEPTKAPPMFYY
jgi:hypothetical protein